MPSGVVVLVAPLEFLAALTPLARKSGDVLAFADTDAPRALDVIMQQRPGVVALERTFAATTRGVALINRVTADPGLKHCEIRIVAHDDSSPRIVVAQPAEDTAVVPLTPLDLHGMRRSPRIHMSGDVAIAIDGKSARLIDLSMVGAQVIASAIVRPRHRVRLAIPDLPRPIRIGASVVWASFEMPKGAPAPQYRAGLDFFEVDRTALQQFIDART